MNQTSIDWDADLPPDPDEEYQALVRALRRTQGFGLLFVRCSPAEGDRLIERVHEDLPQKRLEVLRFNEPIPNGNFYHQVKTFLQDKGKVNVLFVQGLEYSLYDYEETKRLLGWSEAEIRSYSWKGVPRLLSHLNQQRELFRDTFNFCFVFLVPSFVLRYFINRAPDFFDWRSGVFDMPMDQERLQQEISKLYTKRSVKELSALTSEERQNMLLWVQSLLEEQEFPEEKEDLLRVQAVLLNFDKNPEAAITVLNKALSIDPNNHHTWHFRGINLSKLKRHEEAIDSYDRALKINPDDYIAWYDRGNEFSTLKRYEEEISSYDEALKINSANDEIWYDRGIALSDLGCYEEAIDSYDQALKISPDDYKSWCNRGNALFALKRYREAIASYAQAIKINPDDDIAWGNRAIVLSDIERYEEAIDSYNQALKIKPDSYEVWNNRGVALEELGRYKKAIDSYNQALKIKPDYEKAQKNRESLLVEIESSKQEILESSKVMDE